VKRLKSYFTLIGAAIVLALLLVLFSSCVSKEVPVTETYYETEIKREPYTATEEYEIKTPNTVSIFQMEDKYCMPHMLFLFHNDNNDTVRWSNVVSDFPKVKTFDIQPGGRNHRLSITVQVVPHESSDHKVFIGLMRGREPAAINLGFKPNKAASEQVVFVTNFELSGAQPVSRSGYRYWYACEHSGLKETLECIKEVSERSRHNLLARFPDEEELVEKLNIVMTEDEKSLMVNLLETGYYGPSVEILREKQLSSLARPIESSFEEMFQKDGWGLVYITSLPWTIQCALDMSIEYVWDDVEVATRDVTKYRDVPVQVEKQRTVTETKKVPFWEAIFDQQ